MADKRKRNRTGRGPRGDDKRQRICGPLHSKDPVVKQAVLAQYYPRVLSLRDYLLSRLPSTSKIRRKKILSVGRKAGVDGKDDGIFAGYLDSTLVGVGNFKEASAEERLQQWASFSQRTGNDDSNFANLSGLGIFSQSEVVDFTIWLLFQKSRGTSGRVQHLLCEGFRKNLTSRAGHREGNTTSSIPGIIASHHNDHVTAMKEPPWTQVLAIMGQEGERAMIDLILDCGIYVSVESGWGTYRQLSGHPLGDMQTITKRSNPCIGPPNPKTGLAKEDPPSIRSPASITFVRNRILHARAALNAQGGVRFGLRHIHVLNRFPYSPESADSTSPHQSTLRVMMYVFPRQFGLHNVFTSQVDSRETVQPFRDYTLREDEINAQYPLPTTIQPPKRLRGGALRLIEKLQKQQGRCSYKEMLEHYCPVAVDNQHCLQISQTQHPGDSMSTAFDTQAKAITSQPSALILSSDAPVVSRKLTMMDRATPDAMVSAFCRATLANLIPREFWGTGEHQTQNEHFFYRNVDRFIWLRRFESLSLHEVCQGIKITSIEWLEPPNSAGRKMAQSDLNKRWEIFQEFIYYIFDSILIPLIRANFHVTESNIHKYRLFFFRHDVWRSLAEPAIASLRMSMFEEVKLDRAQKILDSRSLGFSQVRLLPKETGVRPIMNLRRRTVRKGYKATLGSSINSLLAPVFNALTFEKTSRPSRLGSTLFSVGDLYTKLKAFKFRLPNNSGPLYFAKLDVKSAFDTIPQDAVIKLMSSLPSKSSYRISRHVEIKPGEGYHSGHLNAKPIRKWIALAEAPEDTHTFGQNLESHLAVDRKNTIFVDSVVSQIRDTDELMALLTSHVKQNLVKIGKKFYRQKEGIPQGSVLSSLLCNYFYADLEAHHLDFLQSDSLLLRLIDDFLLITTNRSHARRFLQVMHDGLPAYGVTVNPDKTLANFEVTINENKISQLVGTGAFPYCGNLIDTRSLDISKDRVRRRDMVIADSLTVEFSKKPGKTFHRKVMNSFKLQSHAMLLDTSHNALHTVLSNLSSAFTECALKMWTYARCLPAGNQPGTKLLIKTVGDLVDLSFVLVKSRRKKGVCGKVVEGGYRCAVNKVQVEYLALCAFKEVLGRRQSRYRGVLAWIEERIVVLRERQGDVCRRISGVLRA